MNDRIFREYDIRGIVDQELFIDKSYKLGQAIVSYMKKKQPQMTTIIVGRDARTHSPALHDNITRAITDMGFDIIDIGIVPSPVLYFAVHELNIQSALIITASHNPKEYNGIKMWGIHGQQIQEIKDIYHGLANNSIRMSTEQRKGTISTFNAIDAYINYLAQEFSHLKNLPLDAVIDCGNGTAGTVIPQLVKTMNWSNVTLLYPEVDGNFPNHEADPTVEKNMQCVKKALNEDGSLKIGLGFDGDCDRMAPMTKEGFLVPGDQLLALFAQDIVKKNPGAPIVFDIKSSSALIELLEQWGAQPIISPSGHSIIKEALIKNKALLGGELSCHFFFNDTYFGYDDGIYAALRLFSLIYTHQKSLSNLLTIIPAKVSSREFRIPCNENDKKTMVSHVKTFFGARKDVQLLTIDGVRAQCDYGWGLIRASNTQMVVCLRFESTTNEGLQHIKEDFINALAPVYGENNLKENIEF